MTSSSLGLAPSIDLRNPLYCPGISTSTYLTFLKRIVSAYNESTSYQSLIALGENLPLAYSFALTLSRYFDSISERHEQQQSAKPQLNLPTILQISPEKKRKNESFFDEIKGLPKRQKISLGNGGNVPTRGKFRWNDVLANPLNYDEVPSSQEAQTQAAVQSKPPPRRTPARSSRRSIKRGSSWDTEERINELEGLQSFLPISLLSLPTETFPQSSFSALISAKNPQPILSTLRMSSSSSWMYATRCP